jgi:hypothetical protein
MEAAGGQSIAEQISGSIAFEFTKKKGEEEE